jgi:hypothetical protein
MKICGKIPLQTNEFGEMIICGKIPSRASSPLYIFFIFTTMINDL